MTAEMTLDMGEFWPGDKVGEYILLEMIRVGGESSIWSAFHAVNNNVVVIKFLSRVGDERSHSKTPKLQSISESLDHPNIGRILGSGNVRGFSYLCMPYYVSGSLDDLLARGKIPIEEALKYSAQLASALDYVHQKGIIHRDLKPDNLLLDSIGHTFLVDFGIARQLSETTQKMHTGHGTPPYSPPEQHTRLPMTARSDIYSFGIMFYKMVTGQLPWRGEVALAIRQMDNKEELPDLNGILPDVPPALTAVLRKVTAADPADRPETIVEAFALIAAAAENKPFNSITSNESAAFLKKVLDEIPDFPEENSRDAEEARALLKIFAGRAQDFFFKMTLTQFSFLNAFLTDPGQAGYEISPELVQLMAYAALSHGHHQQAWMSRLGGAQSQLELIQKLVLAKKDETLIERLLSILQTPFPNDWSIELVSEDFIAALVDLAHRSLNENVRIRILEFLLHLRKPTTGWREIGFDLRVDGQLAQIAAFGGRYSRLAAELIAQIGSGAAVDVLVTNSIEDGDQNSLDALSSIYEIKGNLPQSVPAPIRQRIWQRLSFQQLTADRMGLLIAYLGSALGSGLGLGIHVYLSYRLPTLLNSARILNAVGSALFFGPLIGLGLFLTQWITTRLTTLNRLIRYIVGVATGAIFIYFGFTGYNFLFLDLAPVGYLILFGALVFAMGHGLAGILPMTNLTRGLIQTAFVAFALWVTWQFALRTSQTPLLYYELVRPISTSIDLITTALLFGMISAFLGSLAMGVQKNATSK